VDGEGCGYSVRRKLLSSIDGFSSDLENQKPPVVGFHVTGPCPGCTHVTSDVFPAEAIIMEESGPRFAMTRIAANSVLNQRVGNLEFGVRKYDDTGRPKVAMLRCECVSNHANSKGAFGCGATWLIAATFDPATPGTEAVLSPVEAADAAAVWPAAEAFSSNVSSSLDTVQASAGKWQTGLTAILALVAVTSLIGGRTALQGISTGRQILIVVLAGVAVLANAWAIYRSTLSTIGFPKIKRIKDTPDLRNSDLWPLRQAIHAADNLQAAVRWSAVSLIAAIVAIGFLWLSPQAQPSPVTLTFIKPVNSAISICGSLESSTPSAAASSKATDQIILTRDGKTLTYPLDNIKEIDPGGC
jgi:hypothetical protein